jgi:hypothetical protein
MRSLALSLMIALLLGGLGSVLVAGGTKKDPEQLTQPPDQLLPDGTRVKLKPLEPIAKDPEKTDPDSEELIKAAPEKVDVAAETDKDLLRDNRIDPSNTGLFAFFRERTLPETDRPKIEALVVKLGVRDYRERERAADELVKRGPAIAEFLRKAIQGDDLESVRRAEKCLSIIRGNDLSPEVIAAAIRVLGRNAPAETVRILLAYLPYTDSDAVTEEIRRVLARSAKRSKDLHPDLVAGLKDPVAIRRGAAGEALSHAPAAASQVRPLLKDADPFVRLRVAQGLMVARDADAVPVLIDAIPQVTNAQSWPAKDLLLRLADGRSPPLVSFGNDDASRKKYRDAWLAWWDKNKKTVDLAELGKGPRLIDHTIVVLLDEGQIVELNKAKEIVWKLDNIVFPLDVQFLSNGNVLVAEYHAGRVTERDTSNKIHWSQQVTGPLMAQRLADGRTFIATDTQWFEYDREGRELSSFTMPGGERFMKVAKMANGEVVALTSDSRVVRMNEKGKEVGSFTVNLQMKLFGGRLYMQPDGRVLVPHNAENKVVEYDAQGREVWSVTVPRPVAAVRLPNGNTLVTSMQADIGAVEFDRDGNEKWSYQASTRVTRAIRR